MSNGRRWLVGSGFAAVGLCLKVAKFSVSYVAARLLWASLLNAHLPTPVGPPTGMEAPSSEDALRRRLPMRIDDSTDLVGVYHVGKIVTYQYIVKIDPQRLNRWLLETSVRARSCRNSHILDMLKSGFSFRFVYWTLENRNEPVMSIAIDNCRDAGEST